MGIRILIIILFLFLNQFVFGQDTLSNKVSIKAFGYSLKDISALKKRRDMSDQFFELTKYNSGTSLATTAPFDYHLTTNEGLNRKPFVLNSVIQTPIFIGGTRGYIRNKKGKQIFIAGQVIPHFKVRILRDDLENFLDKSSPVRTPSYLPGIRLFVSHSNMMKSKFKKIFYINAYHHSNGQDGNEYFEETKLKNAWVKGDINTYNGNFSEAVVFEFGLSSVWKIKEIVVENMDRNFWKNRLERQEKRLENYKNEGYTDKPPRKMFNTAENIEVYNLLDFNFEFHFDSLTNKAFKQNNLYGQYRINGKWNISRLLQPITVIHKADENKFHEFAKRKKIENSRTEFLLTYILDKKLNSLSQNILSPIGFFNVSKRLNLSLTQYYRMPGTETSAFYLRAGYLGSDPYNLYFGQQAWFFGAGVSFLHFYTPENKQ